MRQNRFGLGAPSLWAFALLLGSPAILIAQRTVVQDAGGGRKIELVYNASGQVSEQRMLGPDGKTISKTEFEYQPGFYQPQEVATSYWPNGKVKTLIRTSYDANSNFTLEFAQAFDESGQQTGGHRLTHSSETNVYHCYEWNAAVRDYLERQCPAGEEGGGEEGPEQARKYSYDEVVRHLDAARSSARQDQKARSRRTMEADQIHPGIVNKEVGLVLPAQIGAGDRFSGTVVADPQRFEDMAGVKVFRFTLPFSSSGTGSSLLDWEVVASGREPQRADGPVTFELPFGASQLKLSVQQAGSPATAVSEVLDLSQVKSKPRTPQAFQGAPLCIKKQLCAVRGPFGGDAAKTFAAFDDRPATIIAETRSQAYVSVPEGASVGDHCLVLSEGVKVIAILVVVAELLLEQEHHFAEGQALALNVRFQGPSELPDSEWEIGAFSPETLARARKLVPGFELQREARGAKEKAEAQQKRNPKEKDKNEREREEESTGEILLVVKNAQPEQFTLRGSRNGTFAFRLRKPSFTRGDFSYDFVVEAKQAGAFELQGYVIPFLAPVAAQEFTLKTGAMGNKP